MYVTLFRSKHQTKHRLDMASYTLFATDALPTRLPSLDYSLLLICLRQAWTASYGLHVRREWGAP